MLARLGGAFAALLGSFLSTNELLVVGMGATGKATVQATLAPLVVAFGVTHGETILAIAVMSVLTMSVLASVAIELA